MYYLTKQEDLFKTVSPSNWRLLKLKACPFQFNLLYMICYVLIQLASTLNGVTRPPINTSDKF